jgi:hypothetical protein
MNIQIPGHEEIPAAFKRGEPRMDYAHYVENNLAVDSGVTEAACNMLVKQRLCGSGMRWKSRGAKIV